MDYLGLLFLTGLVLGLSALFFGSPLKVRYLEDVDWRAVVMGIVLVAIVRLSVRTPIGMAVASLGGMIGASVGHSIFNRLRLGSSNGTAEQLLNPIPHTWIIGLVTLIYLYPLPTLAFGIVGVLLSQWLPVPYVALGLTLVIPPLYWHWTDVDMVVFFTALIGIIATLDLWPVQGELAQKGLAVVRRHWAWLVIPVVVVILGTLYLNRYVYYGFGMHRDLFRHGNRDYPFVALTFDDGPSAKFTPEILDVLKEKNVTATFFMVGKHVAEHPEIARRVYEEGHEIGNHTYDHANLLHLPPAKQAEEVDRAEMIIKSVTGEKPILFRPPRGLYDNNLLSLLADRQYTLVLYSLSSRDWIELPVEDIVRNVLNKVKPGDVLLFHDSGDLVRDTGGSRVNTVRALPAIIDGLRARGYVIVSLTQMMVLEGILGEDVPQAGIPGTE